MNKVSLLKSLLIPLILVGCSGVVKNDFEGRTPTSAPYWETNTQTITIGPEGGTQSIKLRSSLIEDYNEIEYFPDVRIEPGWVEEVRQCTGYKDCESGGKSEAWNAFYGAKKKRRLIS